MLHVYLATGGQGTRQRLKRHPVSAGEAPRTPGTARGRLRQEILGGVGRRSMCGYPFPSSPQTPRLSSFLSDFRMDAAKAVLSCPPEYPDASSEYLLHLITRRLNATTSESGISADHAVFGRPPRDITHVSLDIRKTFHPVKFPSRPPGSDRRPYKKCIRKWQNRNFAGFRAPAMRKLAWKRGRAIA